MNSAWGELEHISKLLEQHRDAGELYKPEKISGVVLTADQYTPFPLEPGKEPFDEQRRSYRRKWRPSWVLSFRVERWGANHVAAVVLEVVIETIAVIRPVANEMRGFRL